MCVTVLGSKITIWKGYLLGLVNHYETRCRRVTNDHGYDTFVEITIRSFPHSWLITGCVIWVTGVTCRTGTACSSGLLGFIPGFKGVRVAQSFVFCVMCCILLCCSFFGNCIICPSSIYGFWLPLRYLQTIHGQKWKFKTGQQIMKCRLWWCKCSRTVFYSIVRMYW